MVTIQDTGLVDALHRLVVQVPVTVTPGLHRVQVTLEPEIVPADAQRANAAPHSTSPTERVRDFRLWVATLQPVAVPEEVGTLFDRDSIYD